MRKPARGETRQGRCRGRHPVPRRRVRSGRRQFTRGLNEHSRTDNSADSSDETNGNHAQDLLVDAIGFIEKYEEIDANKLQAELYAKHRNRHVSEAAVWQELNRLLENFYDSNVEEL